MIFKYLFIELSNIQTFKKQNVSQSPIVMFFADPLMTAKIKCR